MAISLSKISLPPYSSSSSSPNPLKNTIVPKFPLKSFKPVLRNCNKPRRITAIRATQESSTEKNDTVSEPDLPNEKTIADDQLARIGGADEAAERLGAEIKAVMKQRAAAREDDLSFDGVAREVREIEWPAFGKVVGTTGVVLGVIAGSSVVLLTVNAILAELSDRVFAGRGVQDLFS